MLEVPESFQTGSLWDKTSASTTVVDGDDDDDHGFVHDWLLCVWSGVNI